MRRESTEDDENRTRYVIFDLIRYRVDAFNMVLMAWYIRVQKKRKRCSHDHETFSLCYCYHLLHSAAIVVNMVVASIFCRALVQLPSPRNYRKPHDLCPPAVASHKGENSRRQGGVSSSCASLKSKARAPRHPRDVFTCRPFLRKASGTSF